MVNHVEAEAFVPAEGGCICGAIRFRVSGAPLALSRCHCRSCRRSVGASSVAWAMFRRDQFVYLRGECKRRRSSTRVTRGFCDACGTSIMYELDDSPEHVDLTASSFDEPERFPPSREIWLDQKLSWEPRDEALEGHGGDFTDDDNDDVRAATRA